MAAGEGLCPRLPARTPRQGPLQPGSCPAVRTLRPGSAGLRWGGWAGLAGGHSRTSFLGGRGPKGLS